MNDQTTAESSDANRCDMHTNEALNKSLADFGAPAGVAKPYASARPFLRGLSGIDELRVANRRVHEKGYAR